VAMDVGTNKTAQLTATVAPSTATVTEVTWSSTAPTIASVSSTGLVTAVAPGTASVAATSTDGTLLSGSSAVTVIPSLVLNKTAVALDTVSSTSTAVAATVLPAGTPVTWASDNTAVATVSTSGTITAVAQGTANVTATATNNGQTSSQVVTVTVTTGIVAATSLTVAPTSVSVVVGNTTTLAATVLPSNATVKTVTWSSSSSTIAKVNASTGVVTGVAAGTAVITASLADGSKTATATVTVTKILVTSLTLSPTSASLTTGSTQQLTKTTLPANATDATVTWSSSNTAVATVSTSGLVTAQGTGGAVTITAKTNDGSAKTATATITVTVPPTGVTVSPTSSTIGVGATTTLTATVTPSTATTKTVTWASSNSAVASVSTSGVVTGVAPGTATITPTTTVGSLTPATPATITVKPTLSLSSSTVSLGTSGVTTKQLTATVSPSTATVTWTSSNTSVATVSSSGLVTSVAAGSATITASVTVNGQSASATAAVTVTAGSVSNNMKIGVNFWNIMWDGKDNYFRSGVTWATAQPSTATTSGDATSVWNTQLLADLAVVNGPIRFMDFDAINGNSIINWADRVPATEDQYLQATWLQSHVYTVDSSLSTWYGTGQVQLYNISYEWMIDLCNRTGRDLWICVPTAASDAYVTSLATLIKSNLKSNLKAYVEYSNETWNGQFLQSAYVNDKGVALGLPGEGGVVTNKWYQGGSYSVLRSIQIFKLFRDVFGADMSSRVVRTIAYSGNTDIARQAIGNIVFAGAPSGYGNTGNANLTTNATYNPYGEIPDFLAFGAYIGPYYDPLNDYTTKIDGSASDAQTKFHATIVYDMLNHFKNCHDVALLYKIDSGVYEGGNQLDTNANVFNLSSGIYTEYQFLLDQLATFGLKVFNHYTLYGTYSAGSAWGLKQSGTTADTMAASPKWQAVKAWLIANP